jgi:hypothetical protein
MATGASTADLAVVLVDARKGVLTQTRRHSYICSLLGIRSIVLAVNKIDLVEFSADVFQRIVADYLSFAKSLNFSRIAPIPLSARYGENVTAKSERMPWYDGPPGRPRCASRSSGSIARTSTFAVSPAPWRRAGSRSATGSWWPPRARTAGSSASSPSTATATAPTPATPSR